MHHHYNVNTQIYEWHWRSWLYTASFLIDSCSFQLMLMLKFITCHHFRRKDLPWEIVRPLLNLKNYVKRSLESGIVCLYVCMHVGGSNCKVTVPIRDERVLYWITVHVNEWERPRLKYTGPADGWRVTLDLLDVAPCSSVLVNAIMNHWCVDGFQFVIIV